MAMKRGRKMKHIAEKLEEPTREQQARGGFVRQFVTHVETGTKAMAHICTGYWTTCPRRTGVFLKMWCATASLPGLPAPGWALVIGPVTPAPTPSCVSWPT